MTGPETPTIVRNVEPGKFVWVNRAFTQQLGWSAADLERQPLTEWLDTVDQARWREGAAQMPASIRARHRCKDGTSMALQWKLRRDETGVVALGVVARTAPAERQFEDPTPPTWGNGGPMDPLSNTLRAMALIVEDLHPGRRCSILLLDENGECVTVGAGPSLPEEYNAAVEGLSIGPFVGSCGTAAYWNQPIMVEDIQREGLWRNLRHHAARAGVAACWSHPINAQNGRVLGALALYSPEPGAPSAHEVVGLEMAAKMVALAIERGRAEEALRLSEASAHFQARLLGAVTDVVTSFVDQNDWRTAASRFVGAALDQTGSESGILGVFEPDVLAGRHNPEEAPTTQRAASLYQDVITHGNLDPSEFDGFVDAIVESETPIGSESLDFAQNGSPMRNFLGSAIRVDGAVVAIIGVANAEGGYDAEDIHALSVLSRAASVLFDAYRRQQREAALEDHLRLAAKMEAIGVLAGGVAHDFNNMLAAVQGNAELALEVLPDDSEARPMLREIVAASVKSNELCNQMLAYAGRGGRTVQCIDCNTLIRELGDLQKVTLSKKATLEYDLAPYPVCVEADRAQMNQLVMNLIANAAEALGEESGRIVVSTSGERLGPQSIQQLEGGGDLVPGDYACLSVADTGCGMSPETREKIYDPFFSTKMAGRGLGLAAVSGIVRAHRGWIQLQSEEGQGTTFTVLFPRVRGPLPSADQNSSQGLPSSIQGRILVVDDEPSVRSVHTRILEHAGYHVVSVPDGQEAVEVFEVEGDRFDCVLLDLSMPKLDGEETLRALQSIRRDVRAVLTSGFTEQEMLDRFRVVGFSGFVQKPTSRTTLLSKIQEVLS